MRHSLWYFLIPYAVIFVTGLMGFILHDHGDFVLFLNDLHIQPLDFFFKYATHLGDGIALAIVALFLLIFKRRYGWVLILIGILQSALSWLMKRVIFGKVPRPKNYFEDISQFNLVEGVELHGNYSFPSGHTMTAFSIAAFLSLAYKKPSVSIAALCLAVLAGISRVYLLQHFLIDILAGSLIGTALAFGGYQILSNYLDGSRLK